MGRIASQARPTITMLALILALALPATGCAAGGTSGGADAGVEFAHPDYDKDFSTLANPGLQEGLYDYKLFFLPGQGDEEQSFAGDPMPYYEDGTYYLYYLKDGGDSYHHSIFLATTEDFVSYTEHDGPVIEASQESAQDNWVGTGSVVKVGDKYYFFYTGHAGSEGFEYQEKIMVAEGTSPTSFRKRADWELTPPDELGQKRDFRDPQAYYDEERGVIELTVTAAQDGVARIVKFTLDADLGNPRYDGIILTDPVEAFWNLECSDTFRMGDYWYITYSGQDVTLWYAKADAQYGPYDTPQRIDDELFYAAKHVDDGTNCYMVGWLRRSESTFSTDEVSAWGGNLIAQQVVQAPDGSLSLKPVDAVRDAFADRRELLIDGTEAVVQAGEEASHTEAFVAYERYLATGEFTFEGDGDFGLAFEMDGERENDKLITVSPTKGTIELSFNGGSTAIASTAASLEPGKTYSFTYLQEGSCGTFYVDGIASLTVRLYGVSGRPVRLFAQNNTVRFSDLCEYTMA